MLRRPGAGWKRAGLPDVPVWDHVSGIRVHTSGLVTINGVVYSAFQTPEYYAAYWKAIARQGMSRRRGAMVWALEKARSMANDKMSHCEPEAAGGSQRKESNAQKSTGNAQPVWCSAILDWFGILARANAEMSHSAGSGAIKAPKGN